MTKLLYAIADDRFPDFGSELLINESYLKVKVKYSSHNSLRN